MLIGCGWDSGLTSIRGPLASDQTALIDRNMAVEMSFKVLISVKKKKSGGIHQKCAASARSPVGADGIIV